MKAANYVFFNKRNQLIVRLNRQPIASIFLYPYKCKLLKYVLCMCIIVHLCKRMYACLSDEFMWSPGLHNQPGTTTLHEDSDEDELELQIPKVSANFCLRRHFINAQISESVENRKYFVVLTSNWLWRNIQVLLHTAYLLALRKKCWMETQRLIP